MYADDTAILFHGKTWEEAKLFAEKGLSRIAEWLENSLLSLNAIKTTFLCFSKTSVSKPPSDLSLCVHAPTCDPSSQGPCDCPKLTKSKTVKYLGIIVDECLQWTPHIKIMSSRIRKFIYVFKSLRQIVDSKLMLQTFNALCQSVISYGICAWGGAGKTHLIDAERAQRVILKVLLSLPFREPTTLVYEKVQALSVRKLFVYQSLRRYHRNSANFLLDRQRTKTRNKKDRYSVPKTHSAFARRHYYYYAPCLYNEFNKYCETIKLSNYQIKNKISEWLKGYEYEALESLLRDL